MAEHRFILDLENTLYEVKRNSLGTIAGIRGLPGEKLIASDFDGAAPEVATVEASPSFARAVLEKQLRENGEIESGGRVIILAHRRKSDRISELLYIATPGKPPIELEMERESDDAMSLLFPVQILLSRSLDALKATEPVAILLMHDRHVDAMVGDNRNFYGAFRVSAYRADSDHQLLETNLDHALAAVERENNIRITRIQCLHLLVPERGAARWIEALAGRRGIPCKVARPQEVTIDGNTSFSSSLKLLRDLRPTDSCSPPEAITNYRLNRLLPAAAAGLVLCTVAAFAAVVDREYQSNRLTAEITALDASLRQRIEERTITIPAYETHLDTALTLNYARGIPSIESVLGSISDAARDKATQIDGIILGYESDQVVVRIEGDSDKDRGADSMTLYNGFISDLRLLGYTLEDSNLDTNTRKIRFSIRLTRPIDGRSA